MCFVLFLINILYKVIDELRSSFYELKDKIDVHQFDALQNSTPNQWPLIIKLIKECEANESKIQMHSKQIDVIRKMMMQYDGIIEMQKSKLAQLEIDSPTDVAGKWYLENQMENVGLHKGKL